LLKPLGIWGVMGFAAVDAAFLGMPLDAIVAGYAYADPRRFLLYAAMGAAGSALGSIVIYLIGYKGGELLLVKRIGKKRFNKIKASFERHEFLGGNVSGHAAAADAVQIVRPVGRSGRDEISAISGGDFLRQAAALLAGVADRDPLWPADPRLCGRHGAQPFAICNCRGRGGGIDWVVDLEAA
jgi:hypothetical protein